jgi:phospholipid/cholesterol/gamma-HCH transport system permease protein
MTTLARRWFTAWVEGLGSLCLLAGEVARSVAKQKIALGDLVAQVYFIGIKSQSVVLITGAFTGMVLCAQSYFQFHKVMMDTATLAMVSVAMCSELGPVLTALMVAGRVGAAIAAELGTMKVTEQIDALRTLSTDPTDYLIVPRVLAGTAVLPILTLQSIAIGIGAAYILAVYFLGIDETYVVANMRHYTEVQDVWIGLIKAFIFGGILSLVGCYKGINCGQGAEGVGKATTEAVVFSSITILISNFFLTLVLNRVFQA